MSPLQSQRWSRTGAAADGRPEHRPVGSPRRRAVCRSLLTSAVLRSLIDKHPRVQQLHSHSGPASAQTFAILGGLYTFVSCFSKRLRMKDDGAQTSSWLGSCCCLAPVSLAQSSMQCCCIAGINNGLAGCATGLALGWKGERRDTRTWLRSCRTRALLDFRGVLWLRERFAVFGLICLSGWQGAR